MTEPVKSLQICEDKSVEITTRFGKDSLSFVPSKIIISSLDNLVLPSGDFTITQTLNKVEDYFEVNRGCVHDLWNLQLESEFVNYVQFYLSNRIDGNQEKKDLVTVSYLTDEQLRDFDFSDTMVRFKIEDILTEKVNDQKSAKVSHLVRDIEQQYDFEISDTVAYIQKSCEPKFLTRSEIESIK